jgi:hypothetical protein
LAKLAIIFIFVSALIRNAFPSPLAPLVVPRLSDPGGRRREGQGEEAADRGQETSGKLQDQVEEGRPAQDALHGKGTEIAI